MTFITVHRTARADVARARTGVLLSNLGTPEGTGYGAVRRYLAEFLSDRRIIEASPLIWKPILYGPVLTFRPRKSGAAYQRIWHHDHDESPLRTYTRDQATQLAQRLAVDDVPVAWGMRYGTPSIRQALHELVEQGCDRILLAPLYPQYSATTTATANDQAFRALMRMRNQPAIRTLPPFADHPAYISALARSIDTHLRTLDFTPQMIVASFHGLPKVYVEKGDSYAAECERTIAALRHAMGYDAAMMPLTFQSRFGPAKWLEPYTAPFIESLPARGITRIAVITPGFISDCIETLDEIGNEARAGFVHAGGKELALVPCLNNSPDCIDLLENLVRAELGGWLPRAGAEGAPAVTPST
ncbi:ferrochelatase [Komagataeibacter melaceti]|uniref:Ferrochelatase n=1 Tax=Komagataeibacter melaceti TaxID=2766577 RepID=A0A371YW18_9PROT|nr:ferrochelatase [Komagataeibacter melaceti]RFD18441.1 ferrochelatase [Komagataeibacter melaceti]